MEENKISKINPISKEIEKADLILSKHYLNFLKSKQIVKTKQNISQNNNFLDELNSKVRFFDIKKIVINKNENMRDKLVSMFNSIGNMGASIIFQIHSDGKSVFISFGIKTDDKTNISKYSEVLKNSLIANFPGTEINSVFKDELERRNDKYFTTKSSVSSVTCIPGIRSKEENKDRQFVQGIEKLIDAMQGKRYTLILIADPISLNDIKHSQLALENIYSKLTPFCENQFTFGESETEGLTSSISEGTANTINKSITDTISHTTGKTESITQTQTKTKNFNYGVSAIILSGGGSFGYSNSNSKTKGLNESKSESESKTIGESKSHSNTETKGQSFTSGKNRSYQIKIENHIIKRLLSKIDQTLERYDVCADVGMWNCAMYCISESEYISHMAANIYHSIIRGEKSSLENSAVISWDIEQSKEIINSLKYMKHPFFNMNGMNMTLGTLVSSSELAIQAGLPNHSLPELPVVECAEFGRTVSTYDYSKNHEEYCIQLGNIYHMHKKEELNVKLNPESLSSHTFITGSTGSGKSNTIYHILKQLPNIGVKFLVIEPAKGEYKNIFGKEKNVSIYGTNPKITNMLKINPFSFSKGIHVLEHIDRLIEIFNVCWPMYAAMPAVLKEAIEKSYEDVGWNLEESENKYGDNLYPNFADITRNIRTIIDSSEYDKENKGAYKGSLITRLKSLTNGINGQIFSNKEISNEELFDRNVIVDLSRVGSTETKSLIMGILVLKLQEYRLISGLMNSDIKHITVLEEAHNLLKKTSNQYNQETGNLLGKSVEMLANSIAEMRTYGEGFIIADQAPGLLDLSVIRNTNTKIILRLPDLSDRELVGKSANLNDKQIEELAKLPKGVAVVYQNEWVEPVLCKVEKAELKESKYEYKESIKKEEKGKDTIKQRLEIVDVLFNKNKLGKEVYDKDLKDLELSASSEVAIRKILETPIQEPRYTKLAPIIKELFPKVYDEFKEIYNKTSNVEEWTEGIDETIKKIINETISDETIRDIRQCVILQYVYNELYNIEAYKRWIDGGVR